MTEGTPVASEGNEVEAGEAVVATTIPVSLASTRAEISAGISYTETLGGGWTAARARHELKATESAHQQRLEVEAARHQREEAAKDNALRRWAIGSIGLVILGALVVGTLIATLADNIDTRRWAQGVVVALLSGVIGAATGWFSHKSGA